MKLNLQFFAEEGIGAEVSEPAAQTEPVNENVGTEAAEGTTTTPEGAQTSPETAQAPDMNAIYANARRKAEAEFKKQKEAEDAEFARRFGKYTNPETGQKILTKQDYFDAIDAQERMRAKAELESKGIDYSVIENIVNNSPKIREAEEVLQEMKAQKINQAIQNDLAVLNQMDSSITSLETVPQEVLNLATNKGFSLVDAYKIANYGKVNQQQASAIQQRTINQISGKAHLAPVNGVVQNSNEVEIPADQIASWKEWYPNLSASELRKKYNRVLNAH